MIEYKENTSLPRVVITGMGVVSAVGQTLDSLWDACRSGRSGVRPLMLPAGDHLAAVVPGVPFAAPAESFSGEISSFIVDPSIEKTLRKSLKLMAREIRMGVASAQAALVHAGVALDTFPSERVGVSFASDYIITTPEELSDGVHACSSDGAFHFEKWAEEGLKRMTPVWQLKFLPNMPTSHISILNAFFGPGFNVTNREASVGTAISEALEAIRIGRADAMVVGATGSRIHPMKLVSVPELDDLADIASVPEKASRPFDRDRTGMVLGEGAGALVLESEASARRRGVPILAEVVEASSRICLRYTSASGAKSRFSFSPQDMTQSYLNTLETLVQKSGVVLDTVGHINANGLGTVDFDAAEAAAICAAFGESARRIPVTTVKGNIGNPGAGGGFIDLIASVMALEKGELFPILNNETDDPSCPIQPVRQYGLPAGDSFIKLAGQKYGQTSAVLIRRWSEN